MSEPEISLEKLQETYNVDNIPRVPLFRCVHTIKRHLRSITCIRISPDGTKFAVASSDSTVTVYTIYGDPLGFLTGIHSHGINSVAWSPNGQLLAVACDDGFVSLWESSTFLPLRIFRGHSNHVITLDFSPNGNILASGSLDETIGIWDVSSGVLLRQIDAHTDIITSLQFAPDGSCLVSASFDGSIRIWDIYTGFCLHTIEHDDKASIGSLSLHNGLVPVTSHLDGVIRVWSASDSACLRALSGHCNQQYMTPVRISYPVKSQITPLTALLVHDGPQFELDLFDNVSDSEDPGISSSPSFMQTSSLSQSMTPVPSTSTSAKSSTSRTQTISKDTLSLLTSPSSLTPLNAPSTIGQFSSSLSDDLIYPQDFNPETVGCATRFVPTMIIAGSEDGAVCIWRGHDQLLQVKIKAHGDVIIALDTHPTLALFITGGMDRDPCIKIWTAEPTWHEGEVEAAADRLPVQPVYLPTPNSVKLRLRPRLGFQHKPQPPPASNATSTV